MSECETHHAGSIISSFRGPKSEGESAGTLPWKKILMKRILRNKLPLNPRGISGIQRDPWVSRDTQLCEEGGERGRHKDWNLSSQSWLFKLEISLANLNWVTSKCYSHVQP